METLIMIGQLLLGLSILVGIHEWGHLITAKIFGMRVEKYSIGFPPKIWGKKFGETEYSIGAIPLGGFVKISGMIDESLDTKNLNVEPETWEFRAKPAWQRLIVMMGGIIVNIIAGIIIFIGLGFANGEIYLPKEELNKHGIVADDLGKQLGFQTGDKIVSINGRDYSRFSDIMSADILLGENNYYTVERKGREVRIDMPNDFIGKMTADQKRVSVINPRMVFSVGQVIKESNAEKAGLISGDKILKVNRTDVPYFDQFSPLLDSLKGKKISVLVSRDNAKIDLNVQVSKEGTIGFQAKNDLNYVKRNFGFLEAIVTGTKQAFSAITLNIKGFGKIFSGDIDPRKAVMGPLGIMKHFGGVWNSNRFWYLVGLLSMVLAFMNFLPIPALDGGHVMFLIWEIVTNKKPSDKFMENAQKVGMVILLALMTFVIINDVINF